MMRLTCILIAFAVVGTFADEPEKMVNGIPTSIDKYPHAVSLRINNQHMCGGSIISKYHIITAAHCIEPLVSNPLMKNSLTVVTGATYLNAGGQSYKVANMFYHESYKPSPFGRTAGDDIGILKLSSPIEFSQNQQPLKLPTHDVRQGEALTLATWGGRGFRQPVHNDLQKLHMSCMLWQQCAQHHRITNMAVHPNEFCTLISAGTGTCNGDSGSGVMRDSDRSVIGLVSGGLPCARGLPDIFTNVFPYITWIQKTMQR